MQKTWLGASVASWPLLVLAGGCGDAAPSSSKTCEPGEAIACLASTGCHGYKRCKDDGTAYVACECDSGSAGASAGGSASSTTGSIGGGAGMSSSGGSTTAGGVFNAHGGVTLSNTSGAPTTSLGGGSVTTSGGAVVQSAGRTGTSAVGAGYTGLAGCAGTLVSGSGSATSGGASSSMGVAGSAGVANGVAGSSGFTGRRPKVCDANGENCKCLSIASLGKVASPATGAGGVVDSSNDFGAWLREKSNATVTLYEARQILSKEWLDGFDVILLQNLTGWDFTAEERQAFANWVRAGGGVISLSGYMNNDDREIEPTNALLAFTGLVYEGGGVSGSVPGSTCPADSLALCPQASGPCCYCWNNAMPVAAWNTVHPIARAVTAVGAFMGRSVNIVSATSASTVAQYGTKNVAAATVAGLGRVFSWGDEWVTYRAQWAGGMTSGFADQQNPCYDYANSRWLTADAVFQTMQFWYNAIRFVAPATECEFIIHEPGKVVLL